MPPPCLFTGPVLNPTGDVAVCEGSVAVFNCSFTNGTFPFFELNRTDVVMYKILNVTSSWSGTVLHLEVPGAPWSNDAIIKCVVSGIASEPAVLHVQGTDQTDDLRGKGRERNGNGWDRNGERGMGMEGGEENGEPMPLYIVI